MTATVAQAHIAARRALHQPAELAVRVTFYALSWWCSRRCGRRRRARTAVDRGLRHPSTALVRGRCRRGRDRDQAAHDREHRLGHLLRRDRGRDAAARVGGRAAPGGRVGRGARAARVRAPGGIGDRVALRRPAAEMPRRSPWPCRRRCSRWLQPGGAARVRRRRVLAAGRALDVVPVPEARVPGRRDAAAARVPARALADIARVLPFAAMAYAPARLASGHVEPELLALQAGWLVVLLGCAVGVFAAGERRLEVVGG